MFQSLEHEIYKEKDSNLSEKFEVLLIPRRLSQGESFFSMADSVNKA